MAIIFDKREYCKYYSSLIKTKHKLIFSFFYNQDYNAKILKIDLFFISFTLEYTINALFYNDEMMHRIYQDKGLFDIEYQLPKIIYSSLIALILDALLKLLALSNDDIIAFKQNKPKIDIDKREKDLIKKLKIKFISYFILTVILL